jgi:putative Mn2+ efflux pump MntP
MTGLLLEFLLESAVIVVAGTFLVRYSDVLGDRLGIGRSLAGLLLLAIATSIDAMAVGVSLAFIDVNIWLAAGLIGLATMIMVTMGVMLGRVVGSVLGHRAEIFGGLTLIAVGGWILASHL